jgi:uncharacterized protein
MGAMTANVRDNPDEARFEILEDGQLAGFVVYAIDGAVVDLVHTETVPGFEGRGLAGQLVQQILGEIRRRGQQVRPSCPYVRGYLARHPEEVDLVPAAERPRFGLA